MIRVLCERLPDAKEAAYVALEARRCLEWIADISRSMEARRMSSRSDYGRSLIHAHEALRNLEREALELSQRPQIPLDHQPY